MRQLYPELAVRHQYHLDVGDGHILYLEESGNPDGIPVVVVHGGPGAGSQASLRRFFDAERYRIILFDQRGCGHSTPLAGLEANTTQHLLQDMEQIRQFLQIDQWLLFGGSWGSTLSLVYAQTHPERVLGLVLRGIFLCRPQDIYWFYQEGASRVFPDYWQNYLAPIPQQERDDLVAAYYQRLTSDNELLQIQAAKAWSIWEGSCATLQPSPSVVEHFSHPHVAISLARIECHYFTHNAFLEPDQIVRNAHRLKQIPGIIIHGRYDMVCPLDNAQALHEAWPEARYSIIREAGHAASEPALVDALMRATDEMSDRLGPLFGLRE
ncbi:MAG: prolyl aminopeptidase [Halomonadaceae bacterium]|nr:MAG: prolyl aminopeptidase [Halomonadaceae bacterium]